jgi:hypothetical protein
LTGLRPGLDRKGKNTREKNQSEENYNSKREDLEEVDQGEDERNVIL